MFVIHVRPSFRASVTICDRRICSIALKSVVMMILCKRCMIISAWKCEHDNYEKCNCNWFNKFIISCFYVCNINVNIFDLCLVLEYTLMLFNCIKNVFHGFGMIVCIILKQERVPVIECLYHQPLTAVSSNST